MWQLASADSEAIPDANAFFLTAITKSAASIMTFSDDGQSGGTVDLAVRELIQSTIEHNRLPVFLQFVRAQLEHVTCNCGAEGQPALQIPPVLVPAIRLTHIILRRIIVLSNGDEIVIRKWLGGTSATAATNSSSHVFKLCDACLVCVAGVQVTKATGRLHAEVLTLLLALCSTAPLHRTSAATEGQDDLFIVHILGNDLLRPFLQSLLHATISWGTSTLPAGEYYYVGSTHQPSALNLYNLFGAWYKEHCASVTDLIGLQSAQLLSLLCLYRRGSFRDVATHPALQFMVTLQDEKESLFNLLLAGLSNKLLDHPVVLSLAYVMFHVHPSFAHTCLTRNMATFVHFLTCLIRVAIKSMPCESSATTGGGSTPPFSQAYVSFLAVTVLLVLSQDRTVNRVLQQATVDPGWYTETQAGVALPRYLGTLSLSSLQMVFLARGITRSLQEKCDSLVSMHLAVLENAAPFVEKIDAFAAQRLVLVFTKLLKKAGRLLSLIAAQPEDYDAIAECDFLTSTITSVAEAIVGMLEGADRENYALFYELLYYQASSFAVPAQCPRSAKIASAVRPLAQIVSNYETELASVAVNHSPEDIVNLIKRVTQASGTVTVVSDETIVPDEAVGNDSLVGGRGGGSQETTPTKQRKTAHPARDLMFVYKEADEPYEFFGPFVWACVVEDSTTVPGAAVWSTQPAKLPLFLPPESS